MSDIKSEDTIKRSDAVEVVYKALKTPPLKGALTDTMSLAIAMVQDIPSANRPHETCLKEAEVLLKATRNLLNKQNESIYVLDMLEETVTYYGVECDGSCLIEDIDAWLDLYGSERGADDDS